MARTQQPRVSRPPFRYLVSAAQDSDVKVVAVTSIDSSEVVRRTITEHGNTAVRDHLVAPLNDSGAKGGRRDLSGVLATT